MDADMQKCLLNYIKMEVEVKYELLNIEEVKAKLDEISKKGHVDDEQRDTYYKLEDKQVRIRDTVRGSWVGHKVRIDEISCENYASKVSDGETMAHILNELGFKEVGVVNKIRSTWQYKDCEIAIDLVDGKVFIEVESDKKRDFDNILKEIGAELGERDDVGYLKLMKN